MVSIIKFNTLLFHGCLGIVGIFLIGIPFLIGNSLCYNWSIDSWLKIFPYFKEIFVEFVILVTHHVTNQIIHLVSFGYGWELVANKSSVISQINVLVYTNMHVLATYIWPNVVKSSQKCSFWWCTGFKVLYVLSSGRLAPRGVGLHGES